MSQLIACQDGNGIVLAADSRAIEFEPDGKITELQINRMVQLTSHAALLAGGVAEGCEMGKAVKKFVEQEGLTDIQDIYTAALPFLGSEHEKFMRKKCQMLPVDATHHVYFILAGYTTKDPARPYRLYFLWTKKKLPQLDGDEIELAYTVPRRMGLEYALNQLGRTNAGLNAVLEKVKDSLEALGQKADEVAAPYHYACITKDGFRQID